MGTTIQYELPWLHMILSNLPLPALQAIFHNREELSHYGKLAVKNSKVQGYGSSNVFATVIAEAEKGESSLTDDDVEIEAGGIIIAGFVHSSKVPCLQSTDPSSEVIRRPSA